MRRQFDHDSDWLREENQQLRRLLKKAVAERDQYRRTLESLGLVEED